MKGRRYTTEDLLRLKQSPLVHKPRDLPPPEEWIGSPPDKLPKPAMMPRAKTDGIPYHDRSNPRPSLFDTRHGTRGSSTLPDDIVLGPPKTSFASATSIRTINKITEPTETPLSSSYDDGSARNERMSFRDRSLKDKEKEKEKGGRERWRVGESESNQLGGAARTVKEDSDGWTSVRQRKSVGHAEAEMPFRTQVEDGREKSWSSTRHMQSPSQRPNPDMGQDRTRERDKVGFARRTGVMRGRHEPVSRGRGVEGHDREGTDYGKENIRARDRRDRDHGGDLDWTRGARAEREPEWMDSKDREDRQLVHTAEDFQRWKERMKAGSAPTEEKPKAEAVKVDDYVPEIPGRSQPEPKPDAPIIIDTGVDQFFGLWGDPNTEQETKHSPGQTGMKKEGGKAPAAKASRFTSFFAPHEASKQQPEFSSPGGTANEPPSATKDTSSEDKEGFQRILQMLGGASLAAGSRSTPLNGPSQQPEQRVQEHMSWPVSAAPPPAARDAREEGPSDKEVPTGLPQQQQQQQQQPVSQSEVLRQLTSQSRAPPNRNNEFLFSLMQHPRIPPEIDPQMTDQARPAINFPPIMSGEALFRHTQGVHPNHMANPKEGPPNSKSNNGGGPPPGFFDESIVSASQRRPTLESTGPPPAGRTLVPKPPGLEYMAPGWPNATTMPAPLQQRQIPPPPGLGPDMNSRANNFQPFISPPPGMPYPPNMLHRGAAMGPAGIMNPNLPPPGFFAMPGLPPPGYPPLPFQQPDGMMGGIPHPPPPPPPLPPGSMPPPGAGIVNPMMGGRVGGALVPPGRFPFAPDANNHNNNLVTPSGQAAAATAAAAASLAQSRRIG